MFLSRTRNTPFRVRSGSQGEVDNCVGTSAMSGKVFNEKCVVTGEPARYRDPVTGQPYATLAAFKILRQRFVEQVRPPRVPPCHVRVAPRGRLLGADFALARMGFCVPRALQALGHIALKRGCPCTIMCAHRC